MSGKLLLGIAAFGAGWIALGSHRADAAVAADLTAKDADKTADVGEPQNNVAGIEAVVSQVDNRTLGLATYGGSPVEGVVANATTREVEFCGPSGEPGMKVQPDPESSMGGSDPSTATTATGNASAATTGTEFHRDPYAKTETPGINPWRTGQDVSTMIYEAAFGPNGATGTTQSQRSKTYEVLGSYTGEVW